MFSSSSGSSESGDYTTPQLFEEFIIPYPIKSISALGDNEIAFLHNPDDEIPIYNYLNKNSRSINFNNLIVKKLATTLSQDDKLVFVTSNNVQFTGRVFGDMYGDTHVMLPPAIGNISSVHVSGNKIIIKANAGIYFYDYSSRSWSIIRPEAIITNLDANYALAALSDNLLAIGSNRTIYILDVGTGTIVNSINLHGDIQALTRLDNNHVAVGFVECEFRGNIQRSNSYVDLQAVATDKFTPTLHHKFVSAVRIYNISQPKKVAELLWSNNNRIKFLAAPLSGSRLIVEFTEYLTMPRYAELLPGVSMAGDLLECHPHTTQNNTHFKVYSFL